MSPPATRHMEHYDIIIVGGGTAGCVLAARLSENPGRSVLLLEAGPHYGSGVAWPPALRDAVNMSACLPTDAHNWGFSGDLGRGRTQLAPRGRVVGGSLAINGGLFIRGAPQDFDDWAAAGNDLWSYREVLPFFKKLETDLDIRNEFHGSDGPIPVSRSKRAEWGSVGEAFFDAGRALGFAEAADLNDPSCTRAVGPVPTNTVHGRRTNTAAAYLEPALGRSNLTVKAATEVQRLIFEGQQAKGVEIRSSDSASTVQGGEIILCAGAIMTPALLLRSGVGPADDLRRLSIPAVCKSDGVGRNASDHCSARLGFRPRSRRPVEPEHFSNPVGLSFPTASRERRDDIQITVFTASPNERLTYGLSTWTRARLLAKSARRMPLGGLVRQVVQGSDLILSCTLMTGRSRGHVALKSADPDIAPAITHNLLAEPTDLERLRAGMRLTVDLVEQKSFRDIGARRTAPAASDLSSDQALDRWIAANVGASAHLSGTCRMGPDSDETAVVDQHCRVKGVTGVRVVDASIMPTITSRGPAPSVIMIAERAAALMA